MIRLVCLCLLAMLSAPTAVRAADMILLGEEAAAEEVYAARELQRYWYQLTGNQLAVATEPAAGTRALFVIGQAESNPVIARLAKTKKITISPEDPGPQGYMLKRVSSEEGDFIVIGGSDAVGCLYGVYGLLEDHYGVGFYLGGDVMPEQKRALSLVPVDERKAPLVDVRGFLPWTNFPQSATSYSWEDWRFIIDQMAKMRMNLLHIHNYNGFFETNEPFHNFTLDGFTSRAWFATALTGHRWGGQPGWDPNKYLFGAADLFDDYDFGADCALHNETLSNLEVFRKGVSLFQQVIAYAHTRGVRVALGIELDVIPVEYGVAAQDPRVVSARVEQIATDYPGLDYLLCYQTEMIQDRPGSREVWRKVLDQVYGEMKERSPGTRIGVSGWGLSAEDVAALPEDVICAPIAPYVDTCESGAIYGDREYWGCPWLERDGHSSAYYYTYNIHLSNTIKAWRDRAPNMKGFTCLTWRLTDAIDPKISYIAKAPWDHAGRYDSSGAVYHEYASLNYGENVADAMTAIINENEAVGNDYWGECMPTPEFRPGLAGYVANIKTLILKDGATTKVIEAAEADARHGTQNAPCDEGGECVGYASDGNWLRFEPGLSESPERRTVELRLASVVKGAGIELRLGDENGPVIGKVEVPNTGGWQTWETVTTEIEPVEGVHNLTLRFVAPRKDDREFDRATGQLAAIDEAVARARTPVQRQRLGHLRARIQSARDHIELDRNFEQYAWSDLPGAMESWAKNISDRVTDISSLGNVVSAQNRFVQLNYLKKEQELRAGLTPRRVGPQLWTMQPPADVEARGTPTGARVSWRNVQPGARGVFVYRDGVRLNAEPISASRTSYEDTADGVFTYAVSVVGWDDQESTVSIPARCLAGTADTEPPRIVMISPPTSGVTGEPVWLKARVADGRAYDHVSATLFYRQPGLAEWATIPMTRRTKAVFTASIPGASVTADGLEYYISATDTGNEAFHPAQGELMPLSLVAMAEAGDHPGEPTKVAVEGQTLTWASPQDDIRWYRIYRGSAPDFTAGPESFVTFVDAGTTRFEDGAPGLDGKPLTGTWHYRITAVNNRGGESAAGWSVPVSY